MIAVLVRAIVTALVLPFPHVATGAAPSPAVDQCQGSKYGGSSISLSSSAPKTLSPNGGVFPVLFVHGFTDTSDSWTKPASVTWSASPPPGGPKSFVQWVSEIPGALPVLFDYRDHSLEWVDHEAVGGGLAQAIGCLAERSGQKVVIVAHSMGGLAVRQALSVAARAAQVSLVIPIGSPNLGSFWPNVLTGVARDAESVNRWVQTATVLGSPTVDRAAFMAGYRFTLSVIRNCARQIAKAPASGICGEITPVVAAMKSHAGEGLAAGSQKLADLPPWPKTGVTVHALASNYTGFGTDDWLGDFVVPPRSAVAGAPGFSATQCDLPSARIQDLSAHATGCWHANQPVNQNIVPLALTKLRDDITARSRPLATATDWKNTTYQTNCADESTVQLAAAVRNGISQTPAPEKVYAGLTYDFAVEDTAAGDLTGDGRSEVAVTLSCHPPSTNFFVWEIQIFTDGPTPLTRLIVEPLPNALYPAVNFAPGELAIRDGKLVVGLNYYGPNDCHACGPTIHRTLSWHWDGKRLVQN